MSNAGGASSNASGPGLIATKLPTQTVTRTISCISLVTVTAELCTSLSETVAPVTPSPETNLFGTAPTRSTQNNTVSFRSFKMGTPPIPSPVISTSLGKSNTVFFKTGTPLIPSPFISAGLGNNELVQQVWPLVAIMAVALGFSCL
ncbi:hypothetical protein F4802DRAFT_569449 [Xylaria palmicola]|nr:hypothetical protein F4802DRAFT_569449 [Xylaria palmicola]